MALSGRVIMQILSQPCADRVSVRYFRVGFDSNLIFPSRHRSRNHECIGRSEGTIAPLSVVNFTFIPRGSRKRERNQRPWKATKRIVSNVFLSIKNDRETETEKEKMGKRGAGDLFTPTKP